MFTLRSSLSHRFIYTLIGVVFIITSIFTVVEVFYEIQKNGALLESKISHATQLASNALPLALWQYNTTYINTFADSLLLDPDVALVKISSKDDIVNLEKYQDSTSQTQVSFVNSNDFIIKETSILYNEEHLGNLQLVFSLAASRQELQANLLSRFLLILLLTGAVTFACIWFIRKYIFSPLSNLKSAASLIAEGHLDTKIDIKSHDEIGDLSHSLETMRVSIKELFDGLHELDQLKDNFLANTSHELRTPLNGIIGITEALIDESGKSLTPKVISDLQLIEKSGRRLLYLVNDILDFSFLKHHEIHLDLKPVGLKGLTDVVLTISQPLVGNKSLQLVNSITDELPFALADENRVYQIMYNLVGNAIKFTTRGRVEVSAHLKGDFIVMSVKDTGIGVPPEKQELIFDSFRHVDGTVTKEHGGTGLGLAISKKLVALHGGTIWVESAEKQGATFFFTFPKTETPQPDVSHEPWRITPIKNYLLEAEVEKPPLEETVSLPAQEGRFNILIVDDDAMNVEVISRHLLSKKYGVFKCYDGESALKFLAEHPEVDLVLLDIMMPHISGFEVCKRMRAQHPIHQLPIIFLSAKNELMDVVRGFDLGGSDYLTKPFYKEELLYKIKSHLQIVHAGKKMGSLKGLSNQIRVFDDRQEIADFLIDEFTSLHVASQAFLSQEVSLESSSSVDSSSTPFLERLPQLPLDIIFSEKSSTEEVVVFNHIEASHPVQAHLGPQINGGHLAFLKLSPYDCAIGLYRIPDDQPFDTLDCQYLESIAQQIHLIQENAQAIISKMQLIRLYEIQPILNQTFYVYSEPPNCIIFSSPHDEKVVRLSLGYLEKFYASHLLKVHRSYLINPKKILKIQKDPSKTLSGKRNVYEAVLQHEGQTVTVPIGISYLKDLQSTLPHLWNE